MVKSKLRYYTYKITFKDLPKYFYFGKHKDAGKQYFGSPKTWKHLWDQFEPEIQILQWFETEEEVRAIENKIITATWKDKYSLNEHNGFAISEEVCKRAGRIGGKRTHKEKDETGKSIRALRHNELLHKNRNEEGKSILAASWNEKLHEQKDEKGRSLHSLKVHEVQNEEGKSVVACKAGESARVKLSRPVQATNRKTGEVTFFRSAKQASRELNLVYTNVCASARGEKNLREYTFEYLKW